jgi:hypothetical protein
MPSRLARQAAWIVPALVCLCVFWPGIVAWFQRDDFAWLGLRLEVWDAHSLWQALFAPKAQGTIRPWSERGFFMLYSKLFGLEALPYRLTVFATQTLAIFLLSRVTWRLTSSLLAAFLAPLFWGVNVALGTPLSWTSAYNQVMCSAFLLGAFLLWLKYADTGRNRYYAAQFAVFVLGFGALEINIVYPGLVIAWCVLAGAWPLLPRAIPMVAVSIAYFLYHHSVAPSVKTGLYSLHVDGSMLNTLAAYWLDSFGGRSLSSFSDVRWFVSWGQATPWILSAALAVFVASSLLRRRWLALFGFAWFLATLVPVLPLRDHYSDYYLTIPAIGLALAGAEAVTGVWAWRRYAGLAALILALAAYVVPSTYTAHVTAGYFRDTSKEVERLVFGVQRARELHPKKVILLTDVSTDLFWSGMNDKPFRLLDLDNVYLAPGAESHIREYPELGDVKLFLFPSGQVNQLLDRDMAVVYSAAEGPLRNVTKVYGAIARSRYKPMLAPHVDAGNPLYSDYFKDGWAQIEGGTRWMGRRAAIDLLGPRAAGQRLTIQGYLAKEILIKGPLHLTISVDGEPLPPVTLDQPDSEFIKDFPLPPGVLGKERVHLVFELDKAVIPPGEDRELGLIFGTIAIH